MEADGQHDSITNPTTLIGLDEPEPIAPGSTDRRRLTSVCHANTLQTNQSDGDYISRTRRHGGATSGAT